MNENSEKAKGKSEKVKVILSVHRVVNYTQDVFLTRDMIEQIEELPAGMIDYDSSSDIVGEITEVIDFKDVYNLEEILECDIIEKFEGEDDE